MDFPNYYYDYTDPIKAQKQAYKYLGKKYGKIYPSLKKNKKYMIFDPVKNSWVHFGQFPYEDFTQHKDEKRRQRYLKRTENMKGDWKENPFSPNNLSRNILW